MARPSNTAARREQITRAMVKVMARRGYDGASIGEIAKVARLNPGLIHYHFENKQEILLAVLRELAARHEQTLGGALARAGGAPRAELEAFIEAHLGLSQDADPEALACWILLSGEALRERKLRVELAQVLKDGTRRLAEVIRRGVEEGVFACESVDAAASALVATIQGYFLLAATARTLIPKGSAAAAAKQMAEGLLRPGPPTRAGRPLAGRRVR